MRSRLAAVALAVAVGWGVPATAQAVFPFQPQGTPSEYGKFRVPAGSGVAANDLNGKREWMYASTPEDDSPYLADARELNGVRGAHLADAAAVDQGWQTTTGRPDVTIAVLDSGIKWNDLGPMRDLRRKTRLRRAELPAPARTRATATEPGRDCADYDASGDDLNGDGVFDVLDYACDARVDPDPPRGVGPTFTAADGAAFDGKPMLEPQDVLIAFSDGTDADANGYVDDIVGWDFLDDDNDPFDDVQYGHGTGEALDSGAEADNGSELGTCPNCTQTHLRVGTSFIADVNRFAQAVAYAVDNDAEVVQEALGTLNKSAIGRQAVDYAWEHGVSVVASAADESAQHNNWPSSYPRVILANSVTHASTLDGTPAGNGVSYLQFNGCTNFNAKIDVAIPSVSCSSDAVGRASGMAGLIHSAALNAREGGRLDPHPTCERTDGRDCLVTAAEVKQLMASGSVDGEAQVDDVNFAQTPTGQSTELRCPAPGCTDPFAAAPTTRVATPAQSYPARKGHDQFYGYGRANMVKALRATDAAKLLPEVEITSPEWYDLSDSTAPSVEVRGSVWARGEQYTCQVLVAPGAYPGEADFEAVASDACDGRTARSLPVSGVVAQLDVEALKARFPAETRAAGFRGPEHGAAGEQPTSGRPNSAPYGYVVKLVAERVGVQRRGEDRRQLNLHRDTDMLDGFPKQLAGDGEASPLLVDLDGDNRNELVIANSDGIVHAYRRDGSELDGFPVRGDALPDHTGGRAYETGAVERGRGAFLATPAAADLDHDGTVELVAADLEGFVYVWNGRGERLRRMSVDRRYSGAPLAPFANVRQGKLNRTQLGFLGSPVLADLDKDDGGKLEIVAAAMDRHLYAWEDDGERRAGFPVLMADRAKLASIDPDTHAVTFKPDAGAEFDQGAIVDTPAVGDLTGDGRPEIVVGTNESYAEPLNAGGLDQAAYAPLGAALTVANGRLFAIEAAGEPGGPKLDASPWLAGWPFKVGILQAGILPLVGEGVTGNPVIGVSPCRDDAAPSVRVGVIPAAGVPYLVDPDGRSCLGRQGGRDEGLPTSGGAGQDQPFLAAFGHPAFAPLGDSTAFLAPAAGLRRAVDVVLPEYQGGQDYLVAWSGRTGRIKENWPRPVNDLQFLTGPSVADVDPALPGEEIVAGTAHNDLQAFTAAGTDVPGWPKLTGDWTVANPTLGSFGTLDTEADARRVVVGLTRSGRVSAYATEAGACSAASWPRFHHDDANSGDARRDALSPGKPTDAALVADGSLSFTAPGDDLLCRRAAAFEVRTSAEPITAGGFEAATPVGEPAAATADPGAEAALALPVDGLRRYVAVRAVDDAGNVGRPAVVDRGADASGPSDPSDPTRPPGPAGPTAPTTPTRPGGPSGPTGRPGSPGAGPGGSGGPAGGPGTTSPPSGTAACPLAARATLSRTGLRGGGLDAFRLGRTLRSIESRVGAPTRRRAGGVRRWCVRGGGHVTVLTRGGRVRLVATTASGHRAGRLRRGARLSQVGTARRLRRGVYVRGSVAFGLRSGRVRYLAVADRATRRSSRRLRSALVRAKL